MKQKALQVDCNQLALLDHVYLLQNIFSLVLKLVNNYTG